LRSFFAKAKPLFKVLFVWKKLLGTHLLLPGKCFSNVLCFGTFMNREMQYGFLSSIDTQLSFYHLGQWN
jgi:hypothetical protein